MDDEKMLDERQHVIRKIVISGGPCAGKTTALARIEDAFMREGYSVLVIHETATELIASGIAPWTCGTPYDFQIATLNLQRAKERVFDAIAAKMPDEKILIVCDRGLLDCSAYMTAEEFSWALVDLGEVESTVGDRYEAVFFLMSAAFDAPQAYTLENNSTRIEGIECAIALNDRTMRAWSNHPHLHIIEDYEDFDGKISCLLEAIHEFLETGE